MSYCYVIGSASTIYIQYIIFSYYVTRCFTWITTDNSTSIFYLVDIALILLCNAMFRIHNLWPCSLNCRC